MEYKLLTISFIQNSICSEEYFRFKPIIFFDFIISSNEWNSLIDVLRKKRLAGKLHIFTKSEYDKWSDLILEISLTKNRWNFGNS